MPRAVDPSLVGKQLPIDHSPLNRIEYRVRKSEYEIGDVLESMKTWITDYLFPAITDLTGIDMSVFLPLFDALSLDFSSPIAFLTSVFDSIMALPGAITQIVIAVVNNLLSSEGLGNLTDLLTRLLELLFSLPAMLFDLGKKLLESGAGILGDGSALNALNLFNLIPTDILSHIPMSNIGTAVTNMLTDPHFLDPALDAVAGWTHSLTGGFGSTGMMSVIANGATHELLGNLIPVSEGQILPITGKAKWAGLVGTGNPVAIGITGYQAGSATTQSIVASHSVLPAVTDWLTLAGQYTVPVNVDSLRTRLIVSSTATAGTVSFSDMSVTKIGPMLQRLIAGTDTGEFLPDDIENLFIGIISNAAAIIERALKVDFDELVSTIAGDFGDAIEDVAERIDTFLDSLSPLNGSNILGGNVADQFVAGVLTTIDNIVTQLLGIEGTGFHHADAANALYNNSSTLTSLSARLAQLETTLHGGVADGDDFERTSSSSLGPNWLQYYSSGAGIWATPNGHNASWNASGIGDREFIAILNAGDVRSATDLQRVAMVLSTKAPEWFGFCGHNDIWCRVSDDTTSLANVTGIRFRFGGDGSASIDRFNAGVRVRLTERPPGSITPPGPGAEIIGLAGISGAPRVFKAIIGTSIILQITEVGTASALGSTFRRWGHGGRAEGHLLPTPGQDGPGAAHQWTAMDQLA